MECLGVGMAWLLAGCAIDGFCWLPVVDSKLDASAGCFLVVAAVVLVVAVCVGIDVVAYCCLLAVGIAACWRCCLWVDYVRHSSREPEPWEHIGLPTC